MSLLLASRICLATPDQLLFDEQRQQEVGDKLSVCVLHEGLLILSVFSFTILVWFEKKLKSKTWVFNASVNEYIPAIFEI